MYAYSRIIINSYYSWAYSENVGLFVTLSWGTVAQAAFPYESLRIAQIRKLLRFGQFLRAMWEFVMELITAYSGLLLFVFTYSNITAGFVMSFHRPINSEQLIRTFYKLCTERLLRVYDGKLRSFCDLYYVQRVLSSAGFALVIKIKFRLI